MVNLGAKANHRLAPGSLVRSVARGVAALVELLMAQHLHAQDVLEEVDGLLFFFFFFFLVEKKKKGKDSKGFVQKVRETN